jgi:hypothetical protein
MSKIPDTWGVPDDLAKKITEGLDKKRLTPEEELADALEEMARDLAIIEPDPFDWASWVVYFIDQLEKEAKKKRLDFGGFRKALLEDLLGE